MPSIQVITTNRCSILHGGLSGTLQGRKEMKGFQSTLQVTHIYWGVCLHSIWWRIQWMPQALGKFYVWGIVWDDWVWDVVFMAIDAFATNEDLFWRRSGVGYALLALIGNWCKALHHLRRCCTCFYSRTFLKRSWGNICFAGKMQPVCFSLNWFVKCFPNS